MLLALKNRTLPPTANFERSAHSLGLDDSPFRVLTQAEPWPARAAGQPRRAAISGFGFGGINGHVLIEEWIPTPAAETGARPRPAPGALRWPHSVARVDRDRGPIGPFGPFEGQTLFKSACWAAMKRCPQPAAGLVGLPESLWYRRQGWDERSFRVTPSTRSSCRSTSSAFPPKELGEMLPQQSLMLRVAAEAIADARGTENLACEPVC